MRWAAARLAVAALMVGPVLPLLAATPVSAAITPLPAWAPVGAVPAARADAPGAYDAKTGQFIVFGGTQGDSTLSDTWAFDGRIWADVSGAGPGASDAGPMAYDPALGKVVMLSGTGTAWAFDGAAWAALPGSGPTSQVPGSSVMAFDAAIGRLVLYGTNTWTFDSTTWTALSPATSPTAGTPAGMAYDRDHQRVLLVVNAETWSFDGATWAQLHPAHAPPAATDGTLDYDAVGHRAVLFGGSTSENQTWAFDGTDWQQLTTAAAPSARQGLSAAYDAALGAVVVFGGGYPTQLADTWVLTGSAWAQVGGADQLRTAYDAALGTAFGVGIDGSTWAWDGAAWEMRGGPGTTAPPDALTYDGTHHQLIEYGTDASTTVSDGTTWSKQSPAHHPNALNGVSLAYDSTHSQVLLFGGNSALTALDETWLWDGADWSQQSPAHTPPARESAPIVDDPLHGDAVLGNGRSDSSGGTWSWTGADWTDRATATPVFDYVASADNDPDLGGPVVSAATLSGTSQTWAWDGSAWQQQSPTVAISFGVSQVYDASRHQLVLTAATSTSDMNWVASTASYHVAVAVADTVLTSDGVSATTATATVTDASNTPVSGLPVMFRASGGQPLSAVTDHHDGTYTVTMTSTTDRGPFSVAAFTGTASGSAAFSQGRTLSFSPSTVAFGNSPLLLTGQLPYAQVVTVTNNATSSVTLGAVGWSSGPGATSGAFSFGTDGCSGTVLAPSGSCQVTVSFAPTTVGPQGATLVFADNAPDSPEQLVVSGTGTSVVTLEFSPSPLAFGNVGVGVATPLPVTVTNVGAQQVAVSAVGWNGANGDFAITGDGCSGQVLAVNGQCTVTVTFTPGAPGAQGAVLQFTHGGPDSPQSLSVTGTGVSGAPSLMPPSANFGQVAVGSSSAGTVFTFANPANGTPVTVTGVGLSGKTPAQFGLTDGCSGVTVAPGGNCTVTVTFAPVSVCSASSATLTVTTASIAPSSSVSGTATLPSSPAAGSLTTYCTTPVAQPQDFSPGPDGNMWFDEWGSAFAPGAVASIATDGTLTERSNVVPAGGRWLGFNLTLGADGNVWDHFSQVGFYAQMEKLDATGAFTQYIPPATGPPLLPERVASYNDLVGPDSMIWTGESDYACAGEPVISRFDSNGVPQHTLLDNAWAFANIPNNAGTPCLGASSLAAAPDGTVWAVSVNNSPGVGGLVHFDSKGDIIGFIPMRGLAGITIGQDGSLWVTAGGSPGSTACSLEQLTTNGATASVARTITPANGILDCANPAFGPDGRLWLLGLDTSQAQFRQALFGMTTGGSVTTYPLPGIVPISSDPVVAGTDEGLWFRTGPSTVGRFDLGGGPARGFVWPGTLGFDSTPPGVQSASKSVTLRSTGTSALHVSGVSFSGPGYVVTSDGCTGAVITPGGTCTVAVASVPTGTHSQSATLVFSDDDAFPGTQRVALATFITPPPPTVTPAKVVFAPGAVGTTSAAKTVTLTNVADTPLTMSDVLVAGANANDFVLVSTTCTGVIAPGGACDAKVAFRPSVPAAETAVLQFSDSAIGAVQGAALSGSGTPAPGQGSCSCGVSGPFVAPAVVQPATASSSPHGTYTLSVIGSFPGVGTGGPTEIDISKGASLVAKINASATATWPYDATSWGFSPDDDRFVLHFVDSTGTDQVQLYDLASATPAVPERTFSAFGVTQAVAFSPLGGYLLVVTPLASATQAQVTIAHTTGGATTDYQTSFTFGVPPMDESTGDIGAGGWGFAPDDHSFVFSYLDATSGHFPAYVLVNLQTATQVWTTGGANVGQNFVQFSPCGDALAYVSRDNTNTTSPPVSMQMVSTADGSSFGNVTGLNIGNIVVATILPYWVIGDLSSGLTPTTAAFARLIPGCNATSSTSTSTTGGGGTVAGPMLVRRFAPVAPPSVPSTALVLPGGHGELDIPDNVTPLTTRFTYTEVPLPQPATGFAQVGPAFHLDAADVLTGAPVAAFTGPIVPLLTPTAAELSAVGLTDASTVSLYRWSGTAWVLSPTITGPGDYALLAAPPLDAPLSIVPAPLTAAAGTAFTAAAATFHAVDGFDTPGDYAASIDWGDGSESTAAVTSSAGLFTVTGGHTYAAGGSYTFTVAVTDDGNDQTASASATVSGVVAVPTHFQVSAPPSATAGQQFAATVAALDASDHVVTGYTGTVHLSSTDAGATLPADFALSAGQGTGNLTLVTAGAQTVSASDVATHTISGNAPVTVVAAAASAPLSTVTASPATVPADGVSASMVTVTLVDAFGNAAGGRSVSVASTGAGAVSPPSVATDAHGQASFTVTDKTAETVTLTATDTTDGVAVGQAPTVVFTPVVTGGADVSVALSASRFGAGDPAYYLVTVQDTGTVATSGVLTVTDQLPAGTAFLGALGIGWKCAAKSQVVTCTTSAHLAPKARSSVAVIVAVRARAGTVLKDTATVAMAGPDPTPADNTASVSVVVRRD